MADIDSFTTYVQGKLDDVLSDVATAATDLTHIAQGQLATFEFSAIPDYDDSTQMVKYTPVNVTMDTVPPFVVPDEPTLSNRAAPAAATLNPMDLTQANAALQAFGPDTMDPSTISGEITALAAQILNWIDNGGPGISDATQTALMNNMRARDLQTLDDALLRVRQENSMSGWPRSTSLHEASENELRKRYQDTYDNRSSEILALMTERAHQTAMSAMNAGVSLTGVKSDLQKSVWGLYYSLQGLVLDEFKTLVGAEETRLTTDLKKILGDYEIWKASKEGDKISAEVFDSLMRGEETRVRAETTLATAKADVGLKSNDQILSAAVAETKSQIEKWITTVNQLTERGKAEVQQLLENNVRRLGAAGTQTDAYKGIAIGVTQMVNTLQTKKF